jgi:diaminopimelate epimerase
MIFYKTVAAGNDFLHIDVEDLQSLKDQQAEQLDADADKNIHGIKSRMAVTMCHRQTGPGADGVVFYRVLGQGDLPQVQFEIFNRDGSEAELSGNGMAGVTALLMDLNKVRRSVTLHTRVGERTHHLIEASDNQYRLNIEIGAPDFQARHFFPFLAPGRDEYTFEGINFYPVSVGNPHVVVLLSEETADNTLMQMGEVLESAAIFPHQTNVEFVIPQAGRKIDYAGGHHFRVYYYERGVGPTLASSTGSAAVFAVMRKKKLIDDLLTINNTPDDRGEPRNKGVRVSGNREIFIENSVKIVYKGIYNI